MVDIGTWDRLTSEEQSEYRAFHNRFVAAVKASGTGDGVDFLQKYQIVSDGDHYFLTNGAGVFAGIKSRSRAVIEALFTDAIQNYGR